MDHLRRTAFLLGLLGLATPAARAEPGQLCREAIEAAERAHSVPPRLLTAIARVESGRRDPATGSFHPWPWTVNAEGRGNFYPTKEAAIAAVRTLQAQGVRSIDVGCMQVNLRHHPNAFASVEEAFDPPANARYAARFLNDLQQARGGDWQRATAAYHSSTPELGEPYRARVQAAWAEEQRNPAAPPAMVAAAAPVPAPRAPQGPQFLPAGAGGIGGGWMLSNGAERAQVLAAQPGTGGRGLDAYRTAPIPLAARAPVAGVTPVASIVAVAAPGGVPNRRLF
jgi:Transglycosylase SLT domain